MMGRVRRYWTNLTLFTLGSIFLAACFTLIFVSYQRANSYLHPSRFQRTAEDTPANFDVPFQDIRLITSDGLKLQAWFTPAQNGNVILVAHGYGAARSAELHALFARHGFGVLSWDARAHGESEGDLCTFGYYEVFDVEAAVKFAQQQGGAKHIGAFGQSMGAGTLIIAASQLSEIEAVVADSAFPAIEEMLDREIPTPFLRPFIQFFVEQETGKREEDLRPIDDIPTISPRSVFIIQGADDMTIPPDSARRLFDAAGEPRFLWIGENVGHASMFEELPLEYTQRVIEFFEEAFSSNSDEQ
jgi:fermentation-respiration switch protein FrsA (DUF1100 family)